MNADQDNFETNVFINCPFDEEYVPLLRSLIFVTLYLGYNPRIASERFDSGEPRIDKICELIQQSRYSIHDLSRIQSSRRKEFYRMNMPFELGVDIGGRLFREGREKTKKCLILEKERDRYQKALSDLASSDIKHHNNEPEDLIREVRHWVVQIGHSPAPSGTRIWEDFNIFMADFYVKRESEGFKEKDIQEMPIIEFINFVKEWSQTKSIVA